MASSAVIESAQYARFQVCQRNQEFINLDHPACRYGRSPSFTEVKPRLAAGISKAKSTSNLRRRLYIEALLPCGGIELSQIIVVMTALEIGTL